MLDADDFPQNVGPPFGLDALAGGMSGSEVSSVLGRVNGSRHRIDYSLRNATLGVVGRLAFDGERLGDVVFTFENCEALRSILISRWGAPSEVVFQMTKQLLWQSSQSHWFASMNATGQCSVAFTSSDFFGPTVAAFAQRSQMKPGMTRAAATQLSREVATSGIATELHAVTGGLQGIAYDRATDLQGVAYDRVTDRIEQVYLILPPRAIAALRRAWGNGTIVSGDEPRTVWFDGGTGDRASLEETRGVGDRSTLQIARVTFDKAVRWEDWLGDGPSIKALGSVLGQSIDNLRKERGDAFREDTDEHHRSTFYSLRLPAEEWEPESHSSAALDVDRKVVTSAAVTLLYTTPAIRDQMVRQFEAKWGTKTATKLGFDFKVGGTTVSITDLATEFQINMTSTAHPLR